MTPLTNEDVADILALLDSLPYDELDLQTPSFRLTLRRTPGGWTQSTQVLSAPVPEALNDPAVRMLWGITQERIEAWLSPASDVVRGFGASSGVVEGPARVLTDVNQIGEIRDGEILVCPVTAPSWAPVFGKIKAAVSDIGGSMSHAAIVAREYGMPAVVGTGDATKRIRTGDKVRVDGDRGRVRVLP